MLRPSRRSEALAKNELRANSLVSPLQFHESRTLVGGDSWSFPTPVTVTLAISASSSWIPSRITRSTLCTATADAPPGGPSATGLRRPVSGVGSSALDTGAVPASPGTCGSTAVMCEGSASGARAAK